MTQPISGAKTTIRKASQTIPPAESITPPATAISLSTTKSTTAEPSLSSDSPSMVVEVDTLAPSSRSMATTATGSVADVIVASSRHMSHRQSE